MRKLTDVIELESEIKELARKMMGKKGKIWVVCPGCAFLPGDSFGPLVGSLIVSELGKNNRVKVIGTIEDPLGGQNKLEKLAAMLQKEITNEDTVIVIDSLAVTRGSEIGNIFVGFKHAVTPGALTVSRGVEIDADVCIAYASCKADQGSNLISADVTSLYRWAVLLSRAFVEGIKEQGRKRHWKTSKLSGSSSSRLKGVENPKEKEVAISTVY